MVVLLVYGNMEEPATLILHGNDGTTWLSITVSAKPGTGLDEQIRQALETAEPTNSDPLHRQKTSNKNASN
jgi:hypothetical protein